jgi:hypothetical protein
MLKVRRTLTEILLEVTTEEMEAVAHEVLSKAKAKGIRNFSYTFTFLLRINRVLSRTFSLSCFPASYLAIIFCFEHMFSVLSKISYWH